MVKGGLSVEQVQYVHEIIVSQPTEVKREVEDYLQRNNDLPLSMSVVPYGQGDNFKIYVYLLMQSLV